MKLKEAIRESADIIVNNDKEQSEVKSILHSGGMKPDFESGTASYPKRIALYYGLSEYGIYGLSRAKIINVPSIPAATFIAANSLADTTTNPNIPSPESANV